MSNTLRHSTRESEKEITIAYGPQCSGKTTFFESVRPNELLSLGEHVRQAPDDDDRKILAKQLISGGLEWPVDLGYRFLADVISHSEKPVLDGYPRNIREFNYLVDQIGAVKSITFLEFRADKDSLVARYKERERDDKNQEFFDLRYRQYVEFNNDIKKLLIEGAISKVALRMLHFRIES